jgi:hypothetical protein
MEVPKELLQAMVDKLKARTDLVVPPSPADIAAHLKNLLSPKGADQPTPVRTIMYYGGVIKLGDPQAHTELPKGSKNPMKQMREAWRKVV